MTDKEFFLLKTTNLIKKYCGWQGYVVIEPYNMYIFPEFPINGDYFTCVDKFERDSNKNVIIPNGVEYKHVHYRDVQRIYSYDKKRIYYTNNYYYCKVLLLLL